MASPADLTGQVFGRLTVLGRGPNPYGNGSAFWLCRCDCGTERTVAGYALRKGASRSCGCLRRQTTAKLNRRRARLARIAAHPAPPEAYSRRTARRHRAKGRLGLRLLHLLGPDCDENVRDLPAARPRPPLLPGGQPSARV